VVQNAKVLVASIPVLKAPQNKMPEINATEKIARIEYLALGFLTKAQNRFNVLGCLVSIFNPFFYCVTLRMYQSKL